MPLITLETSVDVPEAKRMALMRSLIQTAARELSVGEDNVRASYTLVNASDFVIGQPGNADPWVMAHVHMKSGRDAGDKAHFCAAIFEFMARELGVPRGAIRILIQSYEPEDWNNGAA